MDPAKCVIIEVQGEKLLFKYGGMVGFFILSQCDLDSLNKPSATTLKNAG